MNDAKISLPSVQTTITIGTIATITTGTAGLPRYALLASVNGFSAIDHVSHALGYNKLLQYRIAHIYDGAEPGAQQ
eukprot:scaffold366410_cov17-Prasinocladus_malaysianus.AAC.1